MKNELLDGFYLGESYVEPLTGRVERDGQCLHLPPKAIEVLLCLAHHPRSLVTREEIVNRVWGPKHSAPDLLSHSIGEIRRVLDDHAARPVVIQTVPKRGYRLLLEPQLRTGAASVFVARESPESDSSIWRALVRHGVIQACAAYLVVGWLLIQVADTTFVNIGLPSWSVPLVTFAVLGGIPIVVGLSWCLEITNGRLRRDSGRSPAGMFSGIERNYLAVVAAYAVSLAAAGGYQWLIGFDQGAAAAPDSVAPSTIDGEADLIQVKDSSIAVLKFYSLDNSEIASVFSEGLSEDILDSLARVPGLLVASRGDSWSLGPNVSSAEVRRRLRVATYVEGSVRVYGDTMRIVTQLIDSDSGFHLMSRSFDRSVEDFQGLQKEITSLIVANMRLALPDMIGEFEAVESDTATLDAYVSYRRGRHILDQPRSAETMKKAIEQFEAALDIDPEYPAAHAGLCNAKTVLYQLDGAVDLVEEAESTCARAIESGPRLPVVLRSAANLKLLTGDLDDAESIYEQALEIDGQDAESLAGLARVYERMRRPDEARSLIMKAIDLQPGNWRRINQLASMYYRAGDYEQAADAYRKVVYLDGLNYVALGNFGAASLMLARFSEARNALIASLRIERSQFSLSNLGIAHYYLGEFEESAEIQREAVAMAEQSATGWLSLADALYFGGEAGAARDAYQKAADLAGERIKVNQADPTMLMTLGWADAMLGETAKARELLTRSLDVAPDDPYSHYFMAIFEANFGDSEAAVAAATDAVSRGYPVAMLTSEPHLAGIDLSSVLQSAQN